MTQTSAAPKARSTTTTALAGAAIAVVALVVQSATASAVSSAVRRACMGDYFSYCSQHAVGSPELRRCMSSNGPNLSKGCVSALIAAGEVSSSEVNRRRAASR